MVDYLSLIINALSNYIPYIFIAGIVAYFLFQWLKPKKEDMYKPIKLEIEEKKSFKKLFDMTQENIGYGKTLYIGSKNIGFILKSIIIPQYSTMETTKNKALHHLKSEPKDNRIDLLGKYFLNKPIEKLTIEEISHLNDLVKNKVDFKDDLNDNEKIINILYGFETCKRGFYNRIMANFGYGLEIFLIDSNAVEEHKTSFNVSPFVKPINELGIWIVSQAGVEELEEVAYKLKHEQHLNAMVNIIPRSTFISDLDAKGKASWDELEEHASTRRKEQLEQIKKA
jgi:hypothetical protein